MCVCVYNYRIFIRTGLERNLGKLKKKTVTKSCIAHSTCTWESALILDKGLLTCIAWILSWISLHIKLLATHEMNSMNYSKLCSVKVYRLNDTQHLHRNHSMQITFWFWIPENFPDYERIYLIWLAGRLLIICIAPFPMQLNPFYLFASTKYLELNQILIHSCQVKVGMNKMVQ